MERGRQGGYKGAHEAFKRFQRLNRIHKWQQEESETVELHGLKGYLTNLIQSMSRGRMKPGTIYEYLAHLNTYHQLKGVEWKETRNHVSVKSMMKEVEHFYQIAP